MRYDGLIVVLTRGERHEEGQWFLDTYFLREGDSFDTWFIGFSDGLDSCWGAHEILAYFPWTKHFIASDASSADEAVWKEEEGPEVYTGSLKDGMVWATAKVQEGWLPASVFLRPLSA